MRYFSKVYLRKFLEDNGSQKSYYFDSIIILLIILSAIFFIIETYSISPWLENIFTIVDVIIIMIFTVEIALRFWVERDKKNYFKSPYNLIDIS